MSTYLAKRIKRAEAAVLPPPAKRIAMLTEPLGGASEADRSKYASELAEAKAEGDLVIVLAALRPLRPYEENGCLMVGTEAEGQLAMLDAMPSEQGNQNALADLLASLNGNIMGVAPGADRYTVK